MVNYLLDYICKYLILCHFILFYTFVLNILFLSNKIKHQYIFCYFYSLILCSDIMDAVISVCAEAEL